MQETIKNSWNDTSPIKPVSKWVKYITYIDKDIDSSLGLSSAPDIQSIEELIMRLSEIAQNSVLLIGLCCYIIEKENLWYDAGYSGYIEYARHIFQETGISVGSLSNAKNSAEAYVANFATLKKLKFNVRRNTLKLAYLQSALETHADRDEVFSHLINDSLADFISYARNKKLLQQADVLPEIEIKGRKVSVNGLDVMELNKALPKEEIDFVSTLVSTAYKIRKTGNIPAVIDVYDNSEKTAVHNFLKKFRQSK